MKKNKLDKKVLRTIARKRQRSRSRHQLWLKSKRRGQIHVSKAKRQNLIEKLKSEKKYKTYSMVKAPSNFCLNQNTEEVVAFIGQLEKYRNEVKSTFVNLSGVTDIDYGAIVALLSIMVQFKESKIKFNGNFPEQAAPREKLERSGFLTNLYKKSGDGERYCISNGSNNSVVTYAWKLVDSELSAKIVREASVTIWGSERRCQGVQRCIGELMLNTNNHAEIGTKGVQNWWLYVSHDNKAKIVSFAFVDFGVGIFQSLSNKPNNSKFSGWISKLKEKLLHGDNANILKLIMSGEFHKTVTGKYYRGKGLPGIAEAMRRKQLSNLMILSNDALGYVALNNYLTIRTPFSGTYVYWELSEENESCE